MNFVATAPHNIKVGLASPDNVSGVLVQFSVCGKWSVDSGG